MSGKFVNVKFKLIAAVCENMGIGSKGALPWRLKKEMQYFTELTSTTKDKTKKNAVIMGRKTWDSISLKFKPLPGRLNIIISKTLKDSGFENVPVCVSLDEAIEKLTDSPFSEIIEEIWIIGGSVLYEEAINSPLCDSIFLTRIQGKFDCDTYFPKIPEYFEESVDENVPSEVHQENKISYRFTVLKNKKEKQNF